MVLRFTRSHPDQGRLEERLQPVRSLSDRSDQPYRLLPCLLASLSHLSVSKGTTAGRHRTRTAFAQMGGDASFVEGKNTF